MQKNKILVAILTLLLIFICHFSFSQVHWLVNTDSVTSCEFIKSGKFVNKESNEVTTSGYYIVFEDGFATEYVQDGKYYLKSKIEFLSDCKYKSTVIEVTMPNYPLGVGTIIHTEIIETALSDNLIEIKSTFEGKDHYFVLQKVE